MVDLAAMAIRCGDSFGGTEEDARWFTGLRVYERYGWVHIDIGMGEPTIYPCFLGLAAEITKKHSISITRNLSLGMGFAEIMMRNRR